VPRIEVHGTFIPGFTGWKKKLLGRRHSQIVYTDNDSDQYCLSAGEGSAREGGGYNLEAEDPAFYDPDDADNAGAQKKILETGGQTSAKWETIKSEAKALTARKLPYRFFKQNCNTAASHFLKQAGVQTVAPPGSGYVGWGKELKP
jgi:hypothetical protein